jgi:hypothetical protein
VSISKAFSFVCEFCYREDFYYRADRKVWAQDRARGDGWKMLANDACVCPRCARKAAA